MIPRRFIEVLGNMDFVDDVCRLSCCVVHPTHLLLQLVQVMRYTMLVEVQVSECLIL